MRSPADIAGTYGAAGAGFTFVGGAKVAQLQNEKGVIIQVHGVQIGLEVNLDLAGMTIALK
jgi:FKBP-type peptidyl-prolyl cis-trans isomerase 2